MVVPYSSSNSAGVNFAQTYTPPLTGAYNFGTSNPDFEVGTLMLGRDGSSWTYVKFGTGGVTGLGYVCVYDEDFLAVMIINGAVGGAVGDKVGVYAGSAAAAANDYGWLQSMGTCDNMQVAASTAANTLLTSTVVAGVLGTAAGATSRTVGNCFLTTVRAASQGNAPAELNWATVTVIN